jgi:hypothetical protein
MCPVLIGGRGNVEMGVSYFFVCHLGCEEALYDTLLSHVKNDALCVILLREGERERNVE